MVEKPADILQMDRAEPAKMSWFVRLDRACRRIPGLGIFIAIALIDRWYSSGSFVFLAVFVFMLVAVILEEFAPRLSPLPEKRERITS